MREKQLKQFSPRCTPKKQSNSWFFLKKNHSSREFKVHTRGRTALAGYLSLILILPGTSVFAGQGNTADKTAGAGIFTQNAPDPKQNIAVVPKELQPGFHLFRAKCAECHSLSRTLQKSSLSSDEWSDIVYRMQDMPSSHMKPVQSAAIAKYLVWNDQFQQKAGK